MSQARLNPHSAAPNAVNAMLELSKFVENSGLERSLLELVKIRASQINGCAYCIHMHVKDARKHGEPEMRLHLLAAWRESPLYSARERAALAWTEALTRLPDTAAPDADYNELSQHFSQEEQVHLTLAITVINSWNRIAVGFRSQHSQE
ncbi:carboxymuconolactone decarboxylase family protein [Candidimonas sp. SYP-B2681]|uniref:carboxymuconolactone decarboxylase family protein n=1 Tax=Candidimonas sp. SYP-B2681 TaxID=2497686 RepID=UPI000F870CF7|nr:carboxymuconolactone decarboxylase family protein [Candidimonas sp. SYP-B2681]RTZ41502.1 carboxymuconolactone decarboxylase family protein [Candidimonas sp. SYP-B2681]